MVVLCGRIPLKKRVVSSDEGGFILPGLIWPGAEAKFLKHFAEWTKKANWKKANGKNKTKM